MLDVIHVLLEEDLTPRYEEHAEVKSAVRTHIYRELYKKEYEYQVKSDKRPRRFEADDPAAFDLPPDNQELKPFIPATNPEDLPGILDAPLGE